MPDTRQALTIAFEAARQAARGHYTPDADVIAALATLSEHSPAARSACEVLWRACTKTELATLNDTTAHHMRGMRAKAAWRRIAVEVGVEVTPAVLVEMHATTRTPADRGFEYKTRAKWLP